MKIEINEAYCSGCAICIAFCPPKVLERAAELNQKGVFVPFVAHLEKCTGCKICELYCPNFSIAVAKDGTE